MFLHMSAAVYSVPGVHHASCSGHIGRQRPPMDYVKMYGSISIVFGHFWLLREIRPQKKTFDGPLDLRE